MAFTGFLKLTDVDGESIKTDHIDEMEIFGMSWDCMQDSSALGTTGLVAGTARPGPFNFQKLYDKASVYLAQSCLTGLHHAEAIFTVRKQSGDDNIDYLEITMTNVIVSHYSMSGGGDQNVVESISLACEEVAFKYVQQNHDGGAGDEHTYARNLVAGEAA